MILGYSSEVTGPIGWIITIATILPSLDNDDNFCIKDYPYNKIKIIHLTQMVLH